jgi:hypothetical protein
MTQLNLKPVEDDLKTKGKCSASGKKPRTEEKCAVLGILPPKKRNIFVLFWDQLQLT